MLALAPSILSADFANLERDIHLVETAGATVIHVDVMDGHFVPNLTIGAPVAKALRPCIKGIMDVHLMVENPEMYLADYKASGADSVTFHLEATNHPHRVLQKIRELGMKAGIAINPGTPVSLLEPLISEIDLILIMSVNPGFGGQSFIPYSLQKIKQAKDLANKASHPIIIQVDGGVGLNNAKELVKAGADWLVAGSAVYGAQDVTDTVKKFVNLLQE